jgi:hypothetical protein
MKIPRFTNLRGIARDLDGDPNYRRLAASIRKAGLAQSCRGDISQSQTCCDALEVLLGNPRKVGTMSRAATENALLVTAVLLYALGLPQRAAAEVSVGRSTFRLSSMKLNGPITRHYWRFAIGR